MGRQQYKHKNIKTLRQRGETEIHTHTHVQKRLRHIKAKKDTEMGKDIEVPRQEKKGQKRETDRDEGETGSLCEEIML